MKMDTKEMELLLAAQNTKRTELATANRTAANAMLQKMLQTYSNLDPEIESISTGRDLYE